MIISEGKVYEEAVISDGFNNDVLGYDCICQCRKYYFGQTFVSAKKGTPEIDGIKDKIWEQCSESKIEKVDKTLVPSDSEVCGTFSAMWDKTYIYLFLQINKNGSGIFTASKPEQSDSVEIFLSDLGLFDGTNDVTNENLPSAGCFRVDANGSLSGYGGYYRVIKDYVKYAFSQTDEDVYNVEIAIPFFNVTPQEEQSVSLEIQINVNSRGEGRDGIIVWNSDSTLGWRDTSEHGEIFLSSEETEAEPEPSYEPDAPDTGVMTVYYLVLLFTAAMLIAVRRRKQCNR